MKDWQASVPQWALRFLRWYCPDYLLESVEGDLLEEFEADVKTYGIKKARRLFIQHTLLFFRPGIIFRNRFSFQSINQAMLQNYFKVAMRSMAKRKLYAFINSFGLSIAIACCVLIYLYIQDENSFDQFHDRKERIVRIHNKSFDQQLLDEGKEPYSYSAWLPAKLADVLQDELPEVEHVTRFNSGTEGVMRYGDKIFKQRTAFADSGFFRMFTFPVEQGSTNKIFRNLHEAVLTEKVATKFFGNENPIGKTFTFSINESTEYVVVAIVAAPPAHSSIDFDMILPTQAQPYFARNAESWSAFSYPTFVQLKSADAIFNFGQHLDTLVNKYMAKRYEQWREREKIPAQYKVGEFDVIPLTDIHLSNQVYWHKVSDEKYAWILMGIGLLILIIACINYIVLSLATANSRQTEIGVRKVVGARQGQLINQFSAESLILSIVAMFIGIGLVSILLPVFNQYTGKSIAFSISNLSQIVGFMFALAIIIGLLAGSYPAFVLSSYKPVVVLKSKNSAKLQTPFAKGMVILQFSLSSILIVSSVIMYKQMDYITSKDLGFRADKVLAIETNAGWTKASDDMINQLRIALSNEPSVSAVSGTSTSFNRGWSRYGYQVNGENKEAYVFRVDENYLSLFDMQLVQGRNFSTTEDTSAVIVNEALVRDMGWKEPLAEYLNWREDSIGRGAPVIGVVKDYNFLSLENDIHPMFIGAKNQTFGHMTTALVKLALGDLTDQLATVERAWKKTFPDKPFEYTFVDQDVARQYATHQRWMKIMAIATMFAIIISCLGLFGLAGIESLNRIKEVGIRKVMGASWWGLMLLLNKKYMLLAIVAFSIASPISWFFMQEWLDTFKFKVDLTWDLFALTLAGGLLIALTTVSYHAMKAARINPAETLKYE